MQLSLLTLASGAFASLAVSYLSMIFPIPVYGDKVRPILTHSS